MKIFKSTKIYGGLILILGILAAINVYLPQGPITIARASGSETGACFGECIVLLILYGALGFAGLKFSQKLGFPDIWDPKVSNRQRFLIPAVIGVLKKWGIDHE